MGVTEDAIAALGDNPPRNLDLEPHSHAARLPPPAGALARVLAQPALQDTFKSYEEAGKLAATAQRGYRRLVTFTFWFIGLAVLAALLAAVWPLGRPLDGQARLTATALIYVALFTALIVMLWLSYRQLFMRWSVERASAELARNRIFDQVLGATEPVKPGELPLLPLQLEYIRRYHLDLQRAFYRQRGEQHRRKAASARVFQWVTAVFVLLWTVFAVLATISPWAEQGPVPAVLQGPLGYLLAYVELSQLDVIALAAGLIAGIVTLISFAMSTLENSLRNAARYQLSAHRLARLADRLADVRAAAAKGDATTVRGFVDELQSILAAEHKDWIELQTYQPARRPEPSRGNVWGLLRARGARP